MLSSNGTAVTGLWGAYRTEWAGPREVPIVRQQQRHDNTPHANGLSTKKTGFIRSYRYRSTGTKGKSMMGETRGRTTASR